MRRSIIRSRPIGPAPSSSSARPYHTCVSTAEDGLCSFRQQDRVGVALTLTRSVASSSRVKNLMPAHIVAIAAPQATEDNRRYEG